MNIRPLANVLRKDSFTLDYDSSAGGMRVVQFSKQYVTRKVEVQLWADGKHRVTHWLNGRMSTLPTYFTTPLQLKNAVVIELVRTDHKPLTKEAK